MRKTILITLLSSLVIGCLPGAATFDVGPDLIPEREPGFEGAQGFCIRDNQNNLNVRVRNQGNQPVLVQTTTSVVFNQNQVRTVTTPALVEGSMVIVSVPIPSGCFNPDCGFTINVDTNDEVEELKHDANDTSHEDNNTAQGSCIG